MDVGAAEALATVRDGIAFVTFNVLTNSVHNFPAVIASAGVDSFATGGCFEASISASVSNPKLCGCQSGSQADSSTGERSAAVGTLRRHRPRTAELDVNALRRRAIDLPDLVKKPARTDIRADLINAHLAKP